MIMRILFYRGGSCNELRVLENLKRIASEVFVLAKKCKNNDMDAELAEQLFGMIHQNKVDMIMSVDYYPIIAEAAHVAGIPYVSWIIDAPHYTLYSTTSLYDSSYIFHFDMEECARLQLMGRPRVYYQPLASDPGYFGDVIRKSQVRKMADVAFLGSSYQNEHDYFEKRKGLNEYDLGYIDGLMKAQSSIYGAAIVAEALPEDLQKRLIEACETKWPETYDLPASLVAATIVEKKISVIERKKIVSMLAENYGITLYSESDALKQKGVEYKGYADYEKEMPLVFRYSRININPTLRNIHSGIALRALDIMACGGFLLSNYQPELAGYFTEGESVAMYGSLEELCDKAGWYLEHEEERQRVAAKGLEIVNEHFTYEQALKNILEIVEGA